MHADYVVRRLGLFLLVVWAAATVNFVLPRFQGRDPVRSGLLNQVQTTGNTPTDLNATVEAYDREFGLDQPLWQQYLSYLGDVAHFNLRYSISSYPQTVLSMIGPALPWTLGLLSISTLVSWLLGSLLGACLAWRRSPRSLRFLLPPLFAFHALPYFIVGLLLIYVLGFRLQLFPLTGGYSQGMLPVPSWSFMLDVAHHALLPGLSIVLVSLGGWAIGMRALVMTIEGEDYMLFGQAKGLRDRSLLIRYGMRNALLPQATALGLALGQLVSGALLVEAVFGYPGVGTLLAKAIRDSDYYLAQGIVFIVIVSIGLATLILDLAYPLLDPRIDYHRP
jgi:peptide/nickel transport system permease protein